MCGFGWSITGGTISSSNGTVANVIWNIGATSGSITASYYCSNGTSGSTTKYVTIRPQLRVPSISGFAGICVGATNTYSIAAVAGATSYTWTFNNGLSSQGLTTVNTTSTSITVSASGTAGQATISVTPNGGCGFNSTTSRTITKETSPIPASSIRIYKQGFSTTDTYMCPSTTYTIRVDAPTARSTSNWTVSGNYTSYYIGTSFVDVTTTSNFSYLNVGVTVTNSCGQTTTLSQNFFKGYSCPGSFMLAEEDVTVFPNPASTEEVTVEWPDSVEVSSVSLLDKYARTLEKIEPKKEKAAFKVNKLPAGEYYLHLYVGEAIIKKKLQVKK
ncbi:hypothetical protein Q0590_26715 [Rhodocytophaga aerolata]|uniref:PKD-like domain-containing protein n=1 Tax=Rhodocytophaga aerolata TaxID=455078 RepID=A0ABT8RCS1_9BACT|nr:hypothetical protein [Rhodocytophaga aerolata]MDO1449901.1 hypothetical protein [Rhodocytophaga aerolata]